MLIEAWSSLVQLGPKFSPAKSERPRVGDETRLFSSAV